MASNKSQISDEVLLAYFVHNIQARNKSENITNNFFAIRQVGVFTDDKVTIPSEKIEQQKEPVAYIPNKSINQAFDILGKIR